MVGCDFGFRKLWQDFVARFIHWGPRSRYAPNGRPGEYPYRRAPPQLIAFLRMLRALRSRSGVIWN